MNRRSEEVGHGKSFEAFSDTVAKPLEEFANGPEKFTDNVLDHLFSSLHTFKKASKAERVVIIDEYLLEAGIEETGINDVNQFIELIDHLSGVERTGWNKKRESNDIKPIKNRKVDNAEDVALHSYGLIHLALLATQGREGLDFARLVKMAAVHDLAESKTGDIVTAGKTDEAALVRSKVELEHAAIKQICAGLEDRKLADELYILWQEYEDKKTPEAQLVSQIDKIEAIIQAYNYSLIEGNTVDPQEFIDSSRKKISDPTVKAILDGVERLVKSKRPSKYTRAS